MLFVAEKAAALDVVHRRLVATRLGDAVLELHSNKTDRKAVLAQLGRGWDRGFGWHGREMDRRKRKAKALPGPVERLCRGASCQGGTGIQRIRCGCLGRPGENRPSRPPLRPRMRTTRRAIKRLLNLAADLGRTHAVVGAGPPLSLVRREEFSFQWEMELLVAIESLREALDELKRAEHTLARELGLRSDPKLDAARRARLKALAPRGKRGAFDISSVPEMPADRLNNLADLLANGCQGACCRQLQNGGHVSN